MNYKMIERIDLDSLDANPSSIPALDAEIANELQRDALFQKWLDKAPDAAR